jgi:endonuclease YncB( thermonuclease family)
MVRDIPEDITLRMSKMKKLLMFLMLLGLPLYGKTTYEPILGTVVGVTDGDTVKVVTAGTLYKVRLYGIDAPEKHQAYGQKAKEHLSELCFNKSVKVEIINQDRYGRFVGKIYVNGVCINWEMLKDGFAWAYVQYLKKEDKNLYMTLERMGKLDGVGLWADKSPIEPWKFRRKKHAK